jgi:hypothetical protein
MKNKKLIDILFDIKHKTKQEFITPLILKYESNYHNFIMKGYNSKMSKDMSLCKIKCNIYKQKGYR